MAKSAPKTEETTAPEAAQGAPEVINVQEGSLQHIQAMNVFEKLLKIEEAAPAIEKSGTNEGQGGWKYMEHPAIAAALRPLFIKYRVKYMFSEISNVITPQQGWDKDAKQVVPKGAKSQKRVQHIFINIDDPADRFEFFTEAEANSTSDKASNASSTYAQKLAYLRTFNLTDVDPDAQALEASPVIPTAKITKSRETDIYTMLERLSLTIEDYEVGLKHKYNVDGVMALTNSQADAEIANMAAYIQRQRISGGENTPAAA